MSGTAERICAKFTVKLCLVCCSDEFECHGHKVKVTRDKNELMHSVPYAVRCTQQKTIPLRRSRGVYVCVWCMFSKTSLALVGSSFIGMSSNIMHDIVTAGLLAKKTWTLEHFYPQLPG